MKTKVMLCGVLIVALLYAAYHLGYQGGIREERSNWIVTYEKGVLMARPSSRHLLMQRARPVLRVPASRNSVPVIFRDSEEVNE